MKKSLLLLLVLCLMLALSIVGTAEAEYPESPHPYAADSDEVWTYTHPEATEALKITFAKETETEDGSDFIRITEAEGRARVFTGKALSGASVYVMGNSFSIGLESDGSTEAYGFSCVEITAASKAEYDKNQPATPFAVSDGVLTRYTGYDEGEIEIPLHIKGHVIKEIGSFAFAGYKNITRITLPQKATRFDKYAFSFSGVKEITLPETVDFIGTGLVVESGVERIHVNPGNKSLHAQDGVLFSSDGTLIIYPPQKSAASYQIPQGTKRIFEESFRRVAKLEKLIIPASVTEIDDTGFVEAESIQEFSVDDKNPKYAAQDGVLFSKDGTRLVAYPVSRPGTEYQVPDTVVSIGKTAFVNARNLEKITLPASVREANDFAFYKLPALKELIVLNKDTTFGENASIQLPENAVVSSYKGGAVEQYCKANDIPFVSLD